jgi:hypothetical protein
MPQDTAEPRTHGGGCGSLGLARGRFRSRNGRDILDRRAVGSCFDGKRQSRPRTCFYSKWFGVFLALRGENLVGGSREVAAGCFVRHL